MGKRRRKRAGFWLKGICLILLVPVFITTLMQRMRLENLIYGKEGAQEVLNTIDSVEGMERNCGSIDGFSPKEPLVIHDNRMFAERAFYCLVIYRYFYKPEDTDR